MYHDPNRRWAKVPADLGHWPESSPMSMPGREKKAQQCYERRSSLQPRFEQSVEEPKRPPNMIYSHSADHYTSVSHCMDSEGKRAGWIAAIHRLMLI